MLRDQPEETADMKILQDMSLDVLNSETVHAYRNRHMAYRREHVWERLSDEEYLERIGVGTAGMETARGYRRVWTRQNYSEIIVCKEER